MKLLVFLSLILGSLSFVPSAFAQTPSRREFSCQNEAGERLKWSVMIQSQDQSLGWGELNLQIKALSLKLPKGLQEISKSFGPGSTALYQTQPDNGIVELQLSNNDDYRPAQVTLWLQGPLASLFKDVAAPESQTLQGSATIFLEGSSAEPFKTSMSCELSLQ